MKRKIMLEFKINLIYLYMASFDTIVCLTLYYIHCLILYNMCNFVLFVLEMYLLIYLDIDRLVFD